MMKVYLRDRSMNLYYAGGNRWSTSRKHALNLRSLAGASVAVNRAPASNLEALIVSDTVADGPPIPLLRRRIYPVRRVSRGLPAPTWALTMG